MFAGGRNFKLRHSCFAVNWASASEELLSAATKNKRAEPMHSALSFLLR
jgi:hypothetical protein